MPCARTEDGRGAAGQAAQPTATHLAAWLRALGREIPASFQLGSLKPTCAACLKQERLLVSLFIEPGRTSLD